ncbi:hypothetical protein F4778DRAFT_782696 [Xylariomycetidae sp. FL2044]|nr:hypothetical protein F4778DRAFT_782696 [Xylariomycetidae sp. FL2044]
MENPVASTPVAVTPAPYGNACTNCARAKCRCILRPGGSCERCYRLKKNCTPTVSVRKRGARAKRSQLEDKLDDLVSLLQAQQPGNIPAHPIIQAAKQAFVSQESPARVDFSSQQTLTPEATSSSSTAHHSPSPVLPAVNTYDGEYLTPTEAEICLDTFRTRYLKAFPFCYIPESTTAEQLQHEKPLLWMNIRAICSKTTQINKLGVRIRQILAQRVVVEGERSLDLLLSVLAYLTWSFFLAPGKAHTAMLTTMAQALISDLRIERLSDDCPPSCFRCRCARCSPTSYPAAGVGDRSNAERRAVLACYIMSTSVGSLLRRDLMGWSPRTQECVDVLSKARESPDDELLMAIARVAKLTDEAGRAARYDPDDPDSRTPPMAHVRGLMASLQHVKRTLSRDLMQNKILLSHIHSTEALIHECALMTPLSPPGSGYDTYEFRRIEYLNACLRAVQAVLDNYLALDPADPSHCCTTMVLGFAHGVCKLYQLTIFDHPGWDRAAVRAAADVKAYMDRSAERLEGGGTGEFRNGVVGEPVATTARDLILAKIAHVIRCTGSGWAAALEKAGIFPLAATATQRVDDDEQPSVSGEMEQVVDPYLEMDMSADTWYGDLFQSWQ